MPDWNSVFGSDQRLPLPVLFDRMRQRSLLETAPADVKVLHGRALTKTAKALIDHPALADLARRGGQAGEVAREALAVLAESSPQDLRPPPKRKPVQRRVVETAPATARRGKRLLAMSSDELFAELFPVTAVRTR